MGGFASGLADAASNLLGGGSAAAANKPTMVDANALFTKDDPVDDATTNTPGAAALDHANVFDPKQPTEFIHFGHVHADVSDRFTHAVLDDTKTTDSQNVTFGSHAILFRAALEREAVLIDGFIAAAKSVVQEMKDGEGSTTELIGAASDLLSGSNTTQGPDPSQLDPYKTAVDTAGGTINIAAIQYKAIHQAGIDLHKAWSNFDKFAPNMAQSPAANGQSGGGLMGNIGSAMGGLGVGGIMDDIKPVTNILFKMFDIYEGMYQNLRVIYEPTIRDNCHQRGMEAIRGTSSPATRGIYDVWSVPLPTDPTTDPVQLVPDNTGVAPIDKAAGEVNQVATDIASIPQKIQTAWTKFWTCTPVAGPGNAEVAAIVAAFATPYDPIFQAFSTGLGVGDLPDFVKTVLTKIIDATSGMLGCVYMQLQNPEAAAKMDENAFLAAGRYYFLEILKNLLEGLLPSFSQALPMVGNLTSDMLVDKAGSILDDEVGKDIDPILEFAMKSCLSNLQAAAQAAGPGGITMEAYFARIPLLVALITRNTFFPVWQLAVEKLFATLGLPAAMIVTPVSSMMQKAKDEAAGAKKDITDLDSSIKNKATSAASGIGSDASNAANSANNSIGSVMNALPGGMGGSGNPLGSSLTGLAGSAGSAAQGVAGQIGSEADQWLGAATAGPAGTGPAFPGLARVTTGNGVDITQDEWQDVDTNQQVRTTSSTTSTDASQDSNSGS